MSSPLPSHSLNMSFHYHFVFFFFFFHHCMEPNSEYKVTLAIQMSDRDQQSFNKKTNWIIYSGNGDWWIVLGIVVPKK